MTVTPLCSDVQYNIPLHVVAHKKWQRLVVNNCALTCLQSCFGLQLLNDTQNKVKNVLKINDDRSKSI